MNLNGMELKSKNKMKVLGIWFNINHKWEDHVFYTINSCQRILHGLKILGKYFSLNKFKEVMTAYLFSKLFYGIEIWSYNLLKYDTKLKLESFFYKACRIALLDFENQNSRQDIYTTFKRASPSELLDFALARTIIKSYSDKSSPLSPILNRSSYQVGCQPNRYLFF